MSYHYAEYNYCPACAVELVYQEIEGKHRKCCQKCGYVHWGEYSLGVGGVLLKDGKGLLVQRAHNPGKGRWTIPGGYVEQDEKIENAIVREVREETGLITAPVSILAVKDRPKDLPGVKHDIYIVFLLHCLGGKLQPDLKEITQAGFYSPLECQDLDIAPLSLHVMNKAIEYSSRGTDTPGFVRQSNISIVGAFSELYTIP